MILTRKLSPFEIALLRAVVELGDEASHDKITKVVLREMGNPIFPRGHSEIGYALDQLMIAGYLETYPAPIKPLGVFPPGVNWRPARDLTAVLGGEGGGEGEA